MQICARLVQDSCGEWYVTLKNNNLSENSFKVYLLDGLFVSGQFILTKCSWQSFH